MREKSIAANITCVLQIQSVSLHCACALGFFHPSIGYMRERERDRERIISTGVHHVNVSIYD